MKRKKCIRCEKSPCKESKLVFRLKKNRERRSAWKPGGSGQPPIDKRKGFVA
jgi:hypothetical protein